MFANCYTSYLYLYLCWLQNDSLNGKSSPSSATAALPGQDGSPLTDTPPVSSKLSVHSDIISQQQFKSPRLQQLLGNRTAGSLSPTATVKSSDSMVPAEADAGAALPQVGATVKLDNNDEAVDVAEV